MINSFADKKTERIHGRDFSIKLPWEIQPLALRKLILLDNAGCLDDLRVPPSNRLELFFEDRQGRYRIYISDRFRVCFSLEGRKKFCRVEIVDHHQKDTVFYRCEERRNSMIGLIPSPSMGEILREEFMEPMGVTAYRLAKEVHVPVSRIQSILNDTRKITADTSLRLAKYFGVSDRYFLDIQNDLDVRSLKETMKQEISTIRPLQAG